jgi:membrane protein required for colicin V production
MSFLRQLTILDWIVLTILLASVVSSVLKGFAREAVSLGSAVAGLLLASWFYKSAGSLVAPYVKTEEIASMFGFGLIFFGILLLGVGISLVINKLVDAVRLLWFDRLLGAAFGFMRGWIIGSVLFLILTAFPVQIEKVKEARLAPYLLVGARVLVTVTPSSLKAKFLDGYDRVQKLWEREAIQHSVL